MFLNTVVAAVAAKVTEELVESSTTTLIRDGIFGAFVKLWHILDVDAFLVLISAVLVLVAMAVNPYSVCRRPIGRIAEDAEHKAHAMYYD